MRDTLDPIGRRVRVLRLIHALTQRQLAERAGVSRHTVLVLEQGRRPPRPDTVRKVARALRVTPMMLTFGSDDLDIKEPRPTYAVHGRGQQISSVERTLDLQ